LFLSFARPGSTGTIDKINAGRNTSFKDGTMVGLTALLLLVTGGITYGWKPDDKGGVEYVIQIPPDQLGELERVGQISSVIDPAVRGSVSRIIVQVGEGPVPRISVPRIMPPERQPSNAIGQDSRNGIPAADVAAVPIPELRDGLTSSQIDGVDSLASQSVMKPQTGDLTGGAGFALPPSLSDPNASGDGRTAADPNAARLVIPPPATRTPGASALPPFTSGDTAAPSTGSFAGSGFTQDMATVRPGGPSTDPTTGRDRNWTMLGQTPPAAAPSTGPAASGATFLPPATTSNGLNPSDTFGRPPAAVAGSNWGQSNGASGAGFSATPGVATNFPQTQRTESESNPFRTRDNLAAGYGDNAYATSGTGAYPSAAASSQPALNRSTLTAEQIAAGAWSVDIYGNPIDREGRPVRVNQPGAFTNNSLRTQDATYANQAASQSSIASLGAPASGSAAPPTNPALANAPSNYSTPSYSNPNYATPPSYSGQQSAGGTFTASPSDLAYQRSAAGSSTDSQPNLSSSVVSSRRSDATGELKPRSQAAQPLVTWLLLISFVSNVYLIFWMKKLLVRYRDLVAAKRVSDSRAAA
jgi:hypothetical protein